MKFLTWLIASLFISAFIITGSSFILDRTLLNAKYLDAKAKEANVYPTVAKLLPQQFLGNQKISDKEKALALSKLSNVITPEVVQSKVDPILTQLQANFKGNGPPVSIDLSDIMAKVRAAGVDVPKDQFAKPIVISRDQFPQFKASVTTFETTKRNSLYASIGLFIILMALSIYLRHFGALIYVFIFCAIASAAAYLGLSQVPTLIQDKLKLEGAMADLKPVAVQFVQTVSHDMSRQFGQAAIAFAVLAVLTVIVAIFVHKEAPAAAEPAKQAKPA